MMGSYLTQLFLLVILVGCGALMLLCTPFGRSTFYAGNARTAKARRVCRQSPRLNGLNILLLVISVGCIFGLYLTGFNLCAFMVHWFPKMNYMVRGLVCAP